MSPQTRSTKETDGETELNQGDAEKAELIALVQDLRMELETMKLQKNETAEHIQVKDEVTTIRSKDLGYCTKSRIEEWVTYAQQYINQPHIKNKNQMIKLELAKSFDAEHETYYNLLLAFFDNTKEWNQALDLFKNYISTRNYKIKDFDQDWQQLKFPEKPEDIEKFMIDMKVLEINHNLQQSYLAHQLFNITSKTKQHIIRKEWEKSNNIEWVVREMVALQFCRKCQKYGHHTMKCYTNNMKPKKKNENKRVYDVADADIVSTSNSDVDDVDIVQLKD